MRRALPIAAALVLGILAGRLSASGPRDLPPPRPDSPGPTRLAVGGVGVGYAHSRAGAVAASAVYQKAFATPLILKGGELRRRIEAVATPQFAPRMLEANGPGTRRLSAGALGAGLREGAPSAFFGVPVFYRMLSYTPRRAVIRSWGFTVLGNASSAEPSAYFGSSRMVLAWVGRDWKIAHTRASFGPTPRLAGPRQGGEGFSLIDLLEGMRRYAVAP